MEGIIDPEFEMGIRFSGDLDVVVFVSAIEVAIQFGMGDELECELVLREDEFFQRSLDLHGNTFMALYEAAA